MRAISHRLEAVARSAWFAYGSLLLIQARVMWGIWDHRDLSLGDTTTYFVHASQWADSLALRPLFAPLYTGLWGSMQWFGDDPHFLVISHRILIALAAGALVLAVLRALLPAALAWALAVWWAVLPVNYDVLYEVHLFAVIPAMLAILIALRWSGTPMRSAVFGVFLAGALLLRTEMVAALVAWSAIWIAFELRERRRGRGESARSLALAAGVPLAAVTVVTAAGALSYWSTEPLDEVAEVKQKLPVCQIYAFGYGQRNDEFNANPFTGCEPLMEAEFDRERPSFAQALAANPGAIGEHVLWNLRLAPHAFQILLFDRSSGGDEHNPEFIPVEGGSRLVLAASLLLAALTIAGLALIWRDRRRWWRDWLRERAWGWAAIASVAAMELAVIVVVRPRPSFILDTGVLALAAIGMAAMALAAPWPGARRLGALAPVLAVALLIALPGRYDDDYVTAQVARPGQPAKETLERLEAAGAPLDSRSVRLLATYSEAACRYGGGDSPCTPSGWKGIADPGAADSPGNGIPDSGDGESAAAAAAARGVDLVYFDGDDLQDPAIAAAVEDLRRSGWRQVAPNTPGEDWALLRAPGPAAAEG